MTIQERGVSRTNYADLRLESAGVRGAGEVAREQLRGHKSDCPWYIGRGGGCTCQTAPVRNPSPIIDAFDKRALLERTDPLLALAFYVEAVADGRTQGGVDAYSKIAAMQAEVRRMLRQIGVPLERVAELYPRYSEIDQQGKG